MTYRLGYKDIRALNKPITQKLRLLTRGNIPSLKNRRIPRVGIIHHPKITVMSVLTGSSTHYLAILYKKKSPKASMPLGAYRLS